MIDLYRNRTFISFQGKCPMNCKHCYTYELDHKEQEDIFKDIDEDSIRSCDIIYVSQKYENFHDEKKGMLFCTELYSKYKKEMCANSFIYSCVTVIMRCSFYNIHVSNSTIDLYGNPALYCIVAF